MTAPKNLYQSEQICNGRGNATVRSGSGRLPPELGGVERLRLHHDAPRVRGPQLAGSPLHSSGKVSSRVKILWVGNKQLVTNR